MLRIKTTTKKNDLRAYFEKLIAGSDVIVNGNRPWDLQVHDTRFYSRVLAEKSLGLGEAYMDGWWDCEQLDVFFEHILRVDVESRAKNWRMLGQYLINALWNKQTRVRAKKVAQIHYNLDNELYRYMLGPSMAYTCAYWKDANNLDQAQIHKYDLVCRKLNITAADEVLELGCGWGGFARYATEHYGCKIVSVNIAEQQIQYAKKLCEGFPATFYLADYRDDHIYNPQHKLFDKVVSIGMCEHVGHKNYGQFLNVVQKQLKGNGLFLLHTIGSNKTVHHVDPWIDKYIFPNGMLPSVKQLGVAMEKDFVLEDWHNFGTDYDKTLMAWHENFMQHWPNLKSRYDDRFFRMWVYYLLSCAGLFRAREAQLWQLVLSKKILGGYQFRI